MPPVVLRSTLSWVPTVALSWLWGLGFFYSLHVTRTYGWAGFLGFAIPNVFGLFLFGFVLGRPGRDPNALFARLQDRFASLFVLAQIAALAVTLHAFVSYLAPLGGSAGIAFLAGLALLVASATGQAFSLRVHRLIHVAYLAVGVAAALFALAALRGAGEPLAAGTHGFDSRFLGLVLPTLVGFLLGPWSDIQQWQRACEIRRAGGSPALAYGLGALLFLALITLNALLAMSAGALPPIVHLDGTLSEQGAVAAALASGGLEYAGAAFVLWAAISLVSTADGAYCALRWFLTAVTSRSKSAILAIVPAALVASPLWIVLAAGGLAALAVGSGLSMIYLMMPFATVFVGPAACLVARVFGRRGRYDSVLCYLIGVASALLFVAGYAGGLASLMTLAPLVGLVGALPMIWNTPEAEAAARASEEGAPSAAAPARLVPVAAGLAPLGGVAELSASHGFDGDWFVMRMTPTYDDTNSVGNVYFANYMRWVGKARELFFNHCMPDFDLASTPFYVLTRSFQHDFRREAQEFEPILVRIRISTHNRKFVTLEHEIHSENHGLLGRGTQSLMFVDTKDYRPLDIPGSIVRGFLPYWPKGSKIAEERPVPANLSGVTA